MSADSVHVSVLVPVSADSVHVSAEAALTQVGQLACFRLLDSHTGWPTRMGLPLTLSCLLLNLSERRFGAHIGCFEIPSKQKQVSDNISTMEFR